MSSSAAGALFRNARRSAVGARSRFRLIEMLRWRNICRLHQTLAGQILEGLEETAAVKKTHESDDVAARGAAATEENLFPDVDAEAILAAALRAGAAAIDPANELDPSPLDLIFNAHGASALDQVARDHGAAHDVSATSRPVRCLGFALTDRTASAVIFQLKRDSPPGGAYNSQSNSPETAIGSPTASSFRASITLSLKATTRHQRVEPLTFSRIVKVANWFPAFEVRSSAALCSAPETMARALIGRTYRLRRRGVDRLLFQESSAAPHSAVPSDASQRLPMCANSWSRFDAGRRPASRFSGRPRIPRPPQSNGLRYRRGPRDPGQPICAQFS